MPIYLNNGNTPLLFIHIPKCAGTSIEYYLRKACSNEFFFSYSSGELPCTPQHFHGALLSKIADVNAIPSFTVVRHPTARIISEYTWQVKKGKIDVRSESLDDFIHKVLHEYKLNNYHMDNHLRPQVEFILKSTLVFRLEYDMEDLKYYLNDILDLDCDLSYRNNSSSSIFDNLSISRRSLELINRTYIEDFLTLGYLPVNIQDECVKVSKISYFSYRKHIYPNVILPSCYIGCFDSLLKKCITKSDKISEKTIWMYWDSGLENAPSVVHHSVNSWRKLNPDYDVIVLSDSNMNELVGFDINNILKTSSVMLGKAGISDLLRLILLYLYGGVWADATTFCLKPLSNWLKSDKDFFSFLQPKECKDRQLVSWFLYSKKEGELIKKLLEGTIDYLFKQRDFRSVIGETGKLGVIPKDYLISRNGTGQCFLDYCDNVGLVPYFWLFYIFNQVVMDFDFCLDNEDSFKYLQPRSLNENINSCYVSKQTYRNDNIMFEQRVKYINSEYDINI